MAKEVLFTGKVQNITALVKECGFPPESYVLVERLPQQVVGGAKARMELLCFARIGDELDIAPYTSGRIFHQDFELRWEKEADERYSVVYLGVEREREFSGLTRGAEELLRVAPAQDPRRYYLFGERIAEKDLEKMGIAAKEGYEDYAEVRIPRVMHYPLSEKAQRVQVIVREYVDEKTGRVKLSRFQGLKPAKE